MGLPTRLERPITTACLPSMGMLYASSSWMQPSGVQGMSGRGQAVDEEGSGRRLCQSVRVLQRMQCCDHAVGVAVCGQWQLHQYATHR